MMHIEHLRKADENYEIRFNSNGDVIHVYFRDGYYIIFPSLHDLMSYVYFGDPDVERFYLEEEDDRYTELCNGEEYNYYKLKEKYNP